MEQLVRHPVIFFIASFFVFTLGSFTSVLFLRRKKRLDDDVYGDFGIVQAASLTLLALLIGFSFSMAVNRYDLRKNYEEEEANAIGTEYLRADLLTSEHAEHIKSLLKAYLQLRIQFYKTTNNVELKQISIQTNKIQDRLWQAVLTECKAQPTPVSALVVSGMNDVINSQSYAQAAWWNRIPVSAWGLLLFIALFCNVLIGYSIRHNTVKNGSLLILPLMMSISLSLVADIDSPRGGIIRIQPLNLINVQKTLTQNMPLPQKILSITPTINPINHMVVDGLQKP